MGPQVHSQIVGAFSPRHAAGAQAMADDGGCAGRQQLGDDGESRMYDSPLIA